MANLDRLRAYDVRFSGGPELVPTPRPDFGAPDFEGTPFLATARQVLESGSNQEVIAPALINSTDELVEINEIVFNLSSLDASLISGAHILARLQLGQFKITQDFVPVALFNRFVSNAGEQQPGNQQTGVEMVWRMSDPILVAPGDLITPSLKHAGLITSDITVTLTYKGRTTRRHLGDTVRIPYLSAFQIQPAPDGIYVGDPDDVPTPTGVVGDDFVATEMVLVNNRPVPVQTRYLTGRMYMSPNLSTSDTQTSTGDGLVDMLDAYYDSAVFIRMETSDGYEVVRTFTPFNLIFDANQRYFPCDLHIESQQSLKVYVQLRKPNQITPFDDPFPIKTIYPMVGMVGSYVVDLIQAAQQMEEAP